MKVLRVHKINNGNVQVSGAAVADDDMNTRSSTAAAPVVAGGDRSSGAAGVTHRNGPAGGTLRVPGPEDPVWDACPWLAELRDVPADACWPRLMTLPHPDAVGSYGEEVRTQYRRRTGKDLRWWQRLVNARALEHDEHGRLVWTYVDKSTARQVGKSTDLRELMEWRTRQTARWGDQLVVHTGKDLGIVQEVMQPAMTHAERTGAVVDWRTSHWAIERRRDVPPPPPLPCGDCRGGGRLPEPLIGPCGTCRGRGHEEPGPMGVERGRWVARQHRAVYGWSPGMGVVDEAWAVPPRTVRDGILPSLVEQTSPQLWEVSTAHPQATGLMLDARVVALSQLFDPRDRLLLEWSAPYAAAGRGDGPDLDERWRWRMASPHWSRQREALIAGALQSARNGTADPEDPDPIGSFRCQWLNQWPHDAEPVPDPEEQLATDDQWAACLDPAAAPGPHRPVILALEDDLGRGAAAAAASLTHDGRVVVGGWNFPTLRDAVDWCEDTAAGAEDAVLLAGASLVGSLETPMDPELEGVDLTVEPHGGTDTRAALPQLRALVRGGRLAHDGAEDVSRAVLDARVKVTSGGAAMLIQGTGSTALVRCVAWAVRRAHRDRD
jgi:hypothetical protein